MTHCCGCMITSSVGILSGKSKLDELEEELSSVGGRKDVYLAFVLKWETTSDIDTWMIEPNGTAIGYNTDYKGKVSGTASYNYVLENVVSDVDMNSRYLTSNKGNLDKDAISDPVPQIENLVYFSREAMQDGLYKYRLDDYAGDHTQGFKVYIIKRNDRLEPDGFAELQWEGDFSHERLQQNAQDMVHLCKQGDNLTFKVMHPRLKLKESNGLNWVTGELNCSGSGTRVEPSVPSTTHTPVEEWRAEHTDVAREDDNFTWTERTHIERKYVDNSRTDETRNSRTEEINRQPKIKWVREVTSTRRQEANANDGYTRTFETTCEVKYSGGQKTQETRNCQERETSAVIANICATNTPQFCRSSGSSSGYTEGNDRSSRDRDNSGGGGGHATSPGRSLNEPSDS